MAVKIRLKRLGKIRSPHYRIVVADSRTKRDGRAIEEIGKYHPKNDPSLIEVDSERAQYWLSVGAQPSEAVVAILKRTGDWQKFSGDKTPSGVEPQPERANKTDAFNAALAAKGDEPRKSSRSKSEPKADAKSDVKADAKADAKPDAKADAKADSKPDAAEAPAESSAAESSAAESSTAESSTPADAEKGEA